jgi:hypothetical protein
MVALKKLYNYKEIIKYSQAVYFNMRINAEYTDKAQSIIFSQTSASMYDLTGSEIINSVLNALDINDKNLNFKIRYLKDIEIYGRKKYRSDIRLTEENQNKFDIIKQKTLTNDNEQLFNILLKLFVDEFYG